MSETNPTDPQTNDATQQMVSEGAPANVPTLQPIAPLTQEQLDDLPKLTPGAVTSEPTPPVVPPADPQPESVAAARELTSEEAAIINTYRTGEEGYVHEGEPCPVAELERCEASERVALGEG